MYAGVSLMPNRDGRLNQQAQQPEADQPSHPVGMRLPIGRSGGVGQVSRDTKCDGSKQTERQ